MAIIVVNVACSSRIRGTSSWASSVFRMMQPTGGGGKNKSANLVGSFPLAPAGQIYSQT